MASSLFGSNPAPNPPRQRPVSNRFGMLGNLKQFAGMLRGRGDPQQLVRNYMKQNGLSQQDLEQTMREAQEIAQLMGLM